MHGSYCVTRNPKNHKPRLETGSQNFRRFRSNLGNDSYWDLTQNNQNTRFYEKKRQKRHKKRSNKWFYEKQFYLNIHKLPNVYEKGQTRQIKKEKKSNRWRYWLNTRLSYNRVDGIKTGSNLTNKSIGAEKFYFPFVKTFNYHGNYGIWNIEV